MARLGEITEEQFNSTVHPTAITKLIRPKQVVKIYDNGAGKGVVIYKAANSNKKQRRTCTEDAADLLIEFNVDEGTTSGVTTLAVTVIQEDNVVYSTPIVMDIAIQQIIAVQADISSATDSRIEYQGFNGKTKIFIVDETVAALKAAANA
jgi:hypothetical protein